MFIMFHELLNIPRTADDEDDLSPPPSMSERGSGSMQLPVRPSMEKRSSVSVSPRETDSRVVDLLDSLGAGLRVDDGIERGIMEQKDGAEGRRRDSDELLPPPPEDEGSAETKG
jgi:hypothetical protein